MLTEERSDEKTSGHQRREERVVFLAGSVEHVCTSKRDWVLSKHEIFTHHSRWKFFQRYPSGTIVIRAGRSSEKEH